VIAAASPGRHGRIATTPSESGGSGYGISGIAQP
jgi:hypothetical protein